MPSPARALHGLLTQLRASDRETLKEAWVEILGAEWDTAQFALRYTAVVQLLQEVANQVAGMAAVEMKQIVEPRLFDWFCLVTQPYQKWNSKHEILTLCPEASLDVILGVAVALEMQPSASLPTITPSNLETLARDLREWIRLVDEDDSLAVHLRDQLVAQIKHVLWLVEMSGKIGTSQAIGAAESLVGRLTTIAAARHSSVDPGAGASVRFNRSLGKIAFTVALLTGLTTAADKDLNAIASVVTDAGQVFRQLEAFPQQHSGDGSRQPYEQNPSTSADPAVGDEGSGTGTH